MDFQFFLRPLNSSHLHYRDCYHNKKMVLHAQEHNDMYHHHSQQGIYIHPRTHLEQNANEDHDPNSILHTLRNLERLSTIYLGGLSSLSF